MRLRLALHTFPWRLVSAGLLLALAAFSAAGTLAAGVLPGDDRVSGLQQASETPRPTVTPPPGPITIAGALPACQLSYVAAPRAQVRTCAGAGCELVTTLPQYEVVCVRGVTDNPDWRIVSLTTEDTSAPLYAIESAAIAPGPLPSETELFQECFQFWEVAVAANVNVRQCPSLECPVMDTLSPGEWVCVQSYGGEYEDWLRADIPGGLRGVWISDAVMQLMEVEGVPTLAPQAAAQAPTLTATVPAAPESTAAPTATPPTSIFQVGGTPDVTATLTPTVTASPTITETPAPVCLPYVIDVAGAGGGNIRRCPTTTCAIIGTLPQNAPVCVLGPAEQAGWFVVDLNPADPNDAPGYIIDDIVRLEGELSQISTPVILPTATPVPTQPVCEPGSTAADCVTATPTPALTPLPVLEAAGPLLAQEVSLARLRVPNLELVSPVGFTQFRFYVPNDWVPDGNNVLYLDLDYFETAGTLITDFGRLDLVSTLDIYLDDQLVAAVSLDQKTLGRQTLAIPLPITVLSDPIRRSHVVQIRFRAEDHCLNNAIAQVFIRSEQSYFHFEFREARPVLDLAVYPRPIYNQRFPGEIESATIVLPAAPTAVDYEVAIALAAGLGAQSYNSLRLDVATADQLTEQDRLSRNLLLVGQIGTNSLIDRYYAEGRFPTVRGAEGQIALNDDPIAADEGIVQVIANPENAKLAIIAVTGQSPEALRKAGQALAGPPSLMGIGGPVAIITGAQPVVRPPLGVTEQTTFTFDQLGEPLFNLGGYGVSATEVSFYVPAGYTLTDEAAVELVFNYAELLEGNRATIALFLNGDVPLASTYLNLRQSEDGALGGPYRLRARIPASAVIPGETNTLQIIVSVQGDWNCYPPDSTIGWVTILGESTVSLPRQQLPAGAVEPIVGWFPGPFNSQVDLRHVWISLSERPTRDEASQAARVVARIASSITGGEGFAPSVSLGELPEGIDLAQYHLLVFGRPTTNPFLAALNDRLPQPFIPGTDDLQQTLDDVTFRLPVGYEIGVLEVLRSPWHDDRVILVITGTGPRGQLNAAAALYDYLYGRTELLGDVVFVSDYAASAIDTRALRDAQAFVEALNELDAQATAQASITPTAAPTEALPTATIQATATEAAPTITPFPTMTLVPSLTPGPTATVTPFFTPTPPPTIATPIPTFAPIPETELESETLKPPDWFEVLLIAAFVVVLSTLIFGLLKLRGRGRRNGF